MYWGASDNLGILCPWVALPCMVLLCVTDLWKKNGIQKRHNQVCLMSNRLQVGFNSYELILCVHTRSRIGWASDTFICLRSNQLCILSLWSMLWMRFIYMCSSLQEFIGTLRWSFWSWWALALNRSETGTLCFILKLGECLLTLTLRPFSNLFLGQLNCLSVSNFTRIHRKISLWSFGYLNSHCCETGFVMYASYWNPNLGLAIHHIISSHCVLG